MGAIRWTGKGLKLVGDLLAAEEVEAWLESKGKAYLETKLRDLGMKWFAGHWRAERKVFAEISDSIRSDTFRSALTDALSILPDTIADLAGHIRERGPTWLHERLSVGWVAVVPRAVVQQQYALRVVENLGGSAELTQFASFPEIFLTRSAHRSEDKFFTSVNLPYLCLSNQSFVLERDKRFDWDLGGNPGHYYCAGSDFALARFEKRAQRREFLREAETELAKLKASLGGLTAAQRKAAAGFFRGP